MSDLCCRCGEASSDLVTVDDPDRPPPGMPVRWCPACRGEGVVRVGTSAHYLPRIGPERPSGT
ncbi:hypothetical protein [Streptomyces sp. CNQ085]|uniref:hypothetical protein n=1 Tax=Streptomyces sp. CNQ085 TaxID=2886944 RepID=UPI001F50FFD7|nr:hypothetical protein [Streptomyces sp. CNQ085]MCI0384601.1 hypothetical protein [Streptomyces sp. CNQ085]